MPIATMEEIDATNPNYQSLQVLWCLFVRPFKIPDTQPNMVCIHTNSIATSGI